MKKKLTVKRHFEASDPEIVFEQLAKADGFQIVGYREYISKIEIVLSKDDHVFSHEFLSLNNKKSRGETEYKYFKRSWQLYIKLCEIHEKNKLNQVNY